MPTAPYCGVPSPRLTHCTKPCRNWLASEVRRCSAAMVTLSLGVSPATLAQSPPAALEEVVVTATKRAVSLQDVPISITALGQTALDDLNITDFQDYVYQLPSVSFTQRRPGQANLFIRGISEGGGGNQSLQGPSAAIYLNEQPVTAIGFNLDVHIYDVERIEVLMGPQGTLYGTASQSGTLRIITNQPDSEAFESGFDVSLESIDNGGENYMVEGFVNVPLTDNAALRVAAWWDDDGGYIDAVSDNISYPFSGISRGNDPFVREDFNTAEKQGLRAALKVDLNDSWTATAAVAHQETDTEGVWDHDPDDLGDLKVSRFFSDDTSDEWTQFSLVVEGDLGFADLTYAGSYLDRDFETYSDYSGYAVDSAYVEPYYTCYVSYFGPCVDPSIQYSNISELGNQTHELRLASAGERLDWIVGAFYMEQETDFALQYAIPTINPAAAIREDFYFLTDQRREDSEAAIFGEITYRFSDRLAGTLGYRLFDGETTLRGISGTVFGVNNVDSKASTDDGTGKLNITYTVNDDTIVYATWAEGYRPGGANRAPGVGEVYEPDFLTSYELGWKSTLAEGRLRFNGAIYFMEWDDIQIGFFDPDIAQVGLVDNIGAAESEGIELDVTWLATAGLELSATYAYNKAELTEDYFAQASSTEPDAIAGQDLPFTPDNKFSLTGKYDFQLGSMDSALQLNWTYTDSMYNSIFFNDREEMDDYQLLSATWRVSKDNWRASVYVENLTDEVAELYINSEDFRRLTTVNQPRTFGVSFGMDF